MKSLVLFLGLLCAAAAIPPTDFNDYRLFHGIPAGCVANTTCTYFVGLNPNGPSLDVYLSAMATGWAAIGFSRTRSMQASDVVGCAVQSGTNMVQAIDTYNEPVVLNNVLDDNQDVIDGTIMERMEGRITCTFSRSIAGTPGDNEEDFDLDGSYFFLFGFDDDERSSAQGFPPHDEMGPGRPTIRGEFNPVLDEGEIIEDNPYGEDPNVTIPTRAPGDYRLRRRDPSGCNPERCDYYMGVDTNEGNDQFLDFYLTADINGWVAVGLSRTANMFDADVLGCNLDPQTGTDVFPVDTHNPGGSTRTNIRDATLTDIIPHSSNFTNGRITCVFSRSIVGNNSFPEDMLLDRSYYFLFGVGENGAGLNGGFPNHGNNLIPTISDRRANPATDSGDLGISRIRQQLLQAHGILMLIAWPLLAFTAIFFAAWMKPALPNGEWFQVHRAFHIAALIVALIGFSLAFFANFETAGLITLGSLNRSGTAHFALGIIIMALQIANPIIALFRCKPNGKYRWVFNLFHGTVIGLGVEVLAYANIGIGVSIFSETQSDFADLTILWVYLAFVVFSLLLNSVLLLFFAFEAGFKGEEGTALAPSVLKPIFNAIYGSPPPPAPAVEMTKPGELPQKPGPPQRKPASADAPIRWIGLGVFLGVMIPLIVTVIVLIAVTGNLDDA